MVQSIEYILTLSAVQSILTLKTTRKNLYSMNLSLSRHTMLSTLKNIFHFFGMTCIFIIGCNVYNSTDCLYVQTIQRLALERGRSTQTFCSSHLIWTLLLKLDQLLYPQICRSSRDLIFQNHFISNKNSLYY
jgi:hypothetical protein